MCARAPVRVCVRETVLSSYYKCLYSAVLSGLLLKYHEIICNYTRTSCSLYDDEGLMLDFDLARCADVVCVYVWTSVRVSASQPATELANKLNTSHLAS